MMKILTTILVLFNAAVNVQSNPVVCDDTTLDSAKDCFEAFAFDHSICENCMEQNFVSGGVIVADSLNTIDCTKATNEICSLMEACEDACSLGQHPCHPWVVDSVSCTLGAENCDISLADCPNFGGGGGPTDDDDDPAMDDDDDFLQECGAEVQAFFGCYLSAGIETQGTAEDGDPCDTCLASVETETEPTTCAEANQEWCNGLTTCGDICFGADHPCKEETINLYECSLQSYFDDKCPLSTFDECTSKSGGNHHARDFAHVAIVTMVYFVWMGL